MEKSRFRIGEAISIADIASPYYAEEGPDLGDSGWKTSDIPDKYDVVFSDGRSAGDSQQCVLACGSSRHPLSVGRGRVQFWTGSFRTIASQREGQAFYKEIGW